MAKKFESRSKFPFVRDVSNIFGAGPRHHDNSVSLTKGTVRRKAKWYFIDANWRSRGPADAILKASPKNDKSKVVAKIVRMAKKTYKDLNPQIHNCSSYMAIYWVTSLEDEMKALKEAK